MSFVSSIIVVEDVVRAGYPEEIENEIRRNMPYYK